MWVTSSPKLPKLKPISFDYSIHNTVLEKEPHTKYLGVTIQSNLKTRSLLGSGHYLRVGLVEIRKSCTLKICLPSTTVHYIFAPLQSRALKFLPPLVVYQ